ncbi:MAG: DUF7144 family membrane protein [Ilumatobacteraceae bacterium]
MANEPDGTLEQAGWATYAAIMLFGGGLVGMVNGVWALRYEEREADLVLAERDLVLWGTILLIGGILMVAISIGVFTGRAWARWSGIVIAVLSIVWNVAWAEIQPTQSLIGALIGISVVFALATNPVTVTQP